MATTARRLTFDDLDLIPEAHPGDRHELIDGELAVTPVPIIKHQIVNANVTSALDRHVRDAGLGMVFHPPTGIRFSPHYLLVPDVCFVARKRLHILGAKTINAAPDLVVEILSPGTRRRDVETKRDVYARFGVREYWIVDLDERMVTVLTLVGNTYVSVPLTGDGKIQSRVFPDLDLTLAAVFTGIADS
jgi:Uma2 family endonuclease